VKRLLWFAAVLGGAAGLTLVVSMPPARLALPSAADAGGVAGILHIHTNRSDGGGAPDDIAAAAARAGLTFVVFTDHGDATRAPDPPAYRAGVLCIDAVEISTTAGHYVALGLPVAPYPLAGEPRDVVEDVRRLGGFGIAAHPDSPKDGLRWGDWNAPIDAVEIINPDTSWRARVVEPAIGPRLGLVASLVTYPFKPEETIASLLGEPTDVLERWDSLTPRRAIVGIAGVDAHAKLAPFDAEPGDNRYALPFPGYEAAFRTLSVRVHPTRPFTGDAAADADALLGGIRAGHLYTAVDAFASPAAFEFSAESGGRSVWQGGELPATEPTISLRVKSNAPPSYTTTIRQGRGAVLAERREQEFTVAAPTGAGVYRVEIRAADRPGSPLWIVSNPIYVRAPETRDPEPERQWIDSAVLFPSEPLGWSVEHDPGSTADLELLPDRTGARMHLRYSLAADPLPRPFVAIAAPVHTIGPTDRLALTVRSEQPMRLSVQLRSSVDGAGEERWQRSVYVDSSARQVIVAFDDMTPVGVTRTAHPPLDRSPTLLFVIDATHAKIGSSGQLWIERVALVRSADAR